MGSFAYGTNPTDHVDIRILYVLSISPVMKNYWRRCLQKLVLVSIVYGLCGRQRYVLSSNFSALIFLNFYFSFCKDWEILDK
jgi:hypothetical protein